MSSHKRHINEFMKTEFHNGRAAGIGIDEDDYSEESSPDKYPHRYKGGVDFVNRGPREPYPVVIIREAKREIIKGDESDV